MIKKLIIMTSIIFSIYLLLLEGISLNNLKLQSFKINNLKLFLNKNNILTIQLLNVENKNKKIKDLTIKYNFTFFKVKVKEYIIEDNNISLETNITNKQLLKYLSKDLSLILKLEKIKYIFNNKIQPIISNSATFLNKENPEIIFSDDTYIDGKQVKDGKMIFKKEGLDIKFNLNEIFDEKLNNIFSKYINIKNYIQKTNKSKLLFNMFLFYDERKSIYNIKYKIEKSDIVILNHDIYINEMDIEYSSKEIKVKVKGTDKKTKINFNIQDTINQKEKSQTGKISFNFKNYLNEKVSCENIDMIFFTEDKNIVFDKIRANCNIENNKIDFSNKNVILDLTKMKIKSQGSVNINKNKTKYNFKHLINSGIITGDIKILEGNQQIKKYLNVENKTIRLKVDLLKKNIKLIDYKVNIDLNNKFNISINDSNIVNNLLKFEIFSKKENEKIKIKIKKEDTSIEGENLVLNLNEINKILKQKEEDNGQGGKEKKYIHKILLKNSNIKYKDRNILFDRIELTNYLFPKITLVKNDSEIIMEKKDGNEVIRSEHISSDILNKILKTNKFFNGQTSFHLEKRKNEKEYEGYLNLKDVILQNSPVIENIGKILNVTPMLINPLLIIPSIPGLVSDVNNGGYLIQKGSLDLNISEDFNIFNIKSFKTKNKINNFKGDLFIDYNTGEIRGNVSVSFLKIYSSILNKIPVINYLFTDKNGSFSTKIEIKGKLNKPVIINKPFNVSIKKGTSFFEKPSFKVVGENPTIW